MFKPRKSCQVMLYDIWYDLYYMSHHVTRPSKSSEFRFFGSGLPGLMTGPIRWRYSKRDEKRPIKFWHYYWGEIWLVSILTNQNKDLTNNGIIPSWIRTEFKIPLSVCGNVWIKLYWCSTDVVLLDLVK